MENLEFPHFCLDFLQKKFYNIDPRSAKYFRVKFRDNVGNFGSAEVEVPRFAFAWTSHKGLKFDFEAHIEKDVGRVRPPVQWSALLPHDEEVHGLIPSTLP